MQKIKEFFKNLKQEKEETILMFQKIKNKEFSHPVVKEQSIDLIKISILGSIIVLPGGSFILFGIIKLFGKRILPSAFQKSEKKKN